MSGGSKPLEHAPEYVQRMRELRARGLTFGQIGIKLGRSPKRVYDTLKYWEGR